MVEAADAARDRPAEHSLRELDMFRALVQTSSIWPAAWLSNHFIRPMRDVNRMVAEQLSTVPKDWRPVMDRLLELIEKRDDSGAVEHLRAHFERVDRSIAQQLEILFAGEDRSIS
jgi:hypothetical protein